jgi:hypothetical protein
VQVFLSNQPIKLKIGSLLLLIEEKADGMHQAERGLQQHAFGAQEGLQIRQPRVAIPQHHPVMPSNTMGTISPSA